MTESGAVGDWSPDGNWFLMSSTVVSADGTEWITIPDGIVDAVWSPDSRYLAFSVADGQGGNETGPASWTGASYVVDVPQRKVTEVDNGSSLSPEEEEANLMWQPKWSPDSSRITFLSFKGATSI